MDQLAKCAAQPIAIRQDVVRLGRRVRQGDQASKVLLIVSDAHAPPAVECAHRRQLVIVAVLLQNGAARKEDHGLAVLLRHNQSTDPGMRDQQAAIFDELLELDRIDVGPPLHVFGPKGSMSDLRENGLWQLRRKRINDGYETVEWKLGSDGQKDHRTAPSYRLRRVAKCSHWVNHSCAKSRAILPLNEG